MEPTDLTQTFTLEEAAKITSINPSDLRNHLKRGFLQYVGPGTPGRERAISVLGLYEMGFLTALSKGGLSLQEASQVIQRGFVHNQALAFMKLMREGVSTTEAKERIQRQPASMLVYDLAHYDLKTPALWVFLFDETWGATVQVAEGWEQVQRVTQNVIKASYPVLIPSVAWDAPPAALPDPPEEYMLSERPLVHIFNVTAVIRQVHAGLQRSATVAVSGKE